MNVTNPVMGGEGIVKAVKKRDLKVRDSCDSLLSLLVFEPI